MVAVETHDPTKDWFLGAIESDGSVDDCLEVVRLELEAKSQFVIALKQMMAPRRKGGLDAISDLSLRIKALENTLRFRLGILHPERPMAWFRAPATTTTGPFASALLDEPVLGPYDLGDVEQIKTDLNLMWQERRATPLPFQSDGPSLWRTLLSLNAELHSLMQLPAPYEHLSLAALPENLPVKLESRALRAFLLNVRNELVTARDRLIDCHGALRKKCEELWAVQATTEPRTQRRRGQTQAHAESVREELRRRRESRWRLLLTGADQRALKCLGFDELPPADTLRRRYLELAKKLHPDRPGGDDHAFKEIASAYSQLLARYEAVSNS